MQRVQEMDAPADSKVVDDKESAAQMATENQVSTLPATTGKQELSLSLSKTCPLEITDTSKNSECSEQSKEVKPLFTGDILELSKDKVTLRMVNGDKLHIDTDKGTHKLETQLDVQKSVQFKGTDWEKNELKYPDGNTIVFTKKGVLEVSRDGKSHINPDAANEPTPLPMDCIKDLFRAKGSDLAVSELSKLEKSLDEIMARMTEDDLSNADAKSVATIMLCSGAFLHKAAELYPDKAAYLNALAETDMRAAHDEMVLRFGPITPETLPSTKALHDLLKSLPARDEPETKELGEHMYQAMLMNKIIRDVESNKKTKDEPTPNDSVFEAMAHMKKQGGSPAVNAFFDAVNARLKSHYIVTASDNQYLISPKNVPIGKGFKISSPKD